MAGEVLSDKTGYNNSSSNSDMNVNDIVNDYDNDVDFTSTSHNASTCTTPNKSSSVLNIDLIKNFKFNVNSNQRIHHNERFDNQKLLNFRKTFASNQLKSLIRRNNHTFSGNKCNNRSFRKNNQIISQNSQNNDIGSSLNTNNCNFNSNNTNVIDNNIPPVINVSDDDDDDYNYNTNVDINVIDHHYHKIVSTSIPIGQ